MSDIFIKGAVALTLLVFAPVLLPLQLLSGVVYLGISRVFKDDTE